MIEQAAPKVRRRSLYRVQLLGSIRADEVMPAAELRRRLRSARKSYTRAGGRASRSSGTGASTMYWGGTLSHSLRPAGRPRSSR